MTIENISVSSSIYHGLWTTIYFHISSVDEIASASAKLLGELKSRNQQLPDKVNARLIETSIRKMHLTTDNEAIAQVNFQLDYTSTNQEITVGVDWSQIPKANHALFNVIPDSSGNLHKEILMSNNEKIRMTLVKDSWNNEGGIRIQIRDVDGHLQPGPEIPLTYVKKVILELDNLSKNSS